MKHTLMAAMTVFAMGGTAVSAETLATVETEIGDVVAAAANGMTLYTFRKDGENASNCYNDCATAWPPFAATAAARASGDLGIIERKDGTRQWTLKGQPLYFWQGDAATGDVTGDGVGGAWDVVRK